MNDQSPPSIWERSTCARCFRWLFSWRGARRILIVLAWAATIIALLYGEENWRGRRAWNEYRKEMEARGEQFDLTAFIPKPIPDEQNFAATPFFEFVFARKGNEHEWQDGFSRADALVSSSPKKSNRAYRRLIDLVAWQMAYDAVRSGDTRSRQRFESGLLDRESRAKAAPAVLEAMNSNAAIFAELRDSSRRPSSRYPIVYDLDNPWGIRIPHLALIKGAVQRLKIKACAELAAGRGDQALEDVELMLRLADSLKDETVVISYLVRVACFQIAIQPIWEGLAEGRWSDAQLQALQSRLQQYDFLKDLERPLDAERAAAVLTADLLYRQKYRLSTLGETSESSDPSPVGRSLTDVIGRLAPHGWYHLEQLNYCRLQDRQLEGTWDVARKESGPIKSKFALVSWSGKSPQAVLGKLSTPRCTIVCWPRCFFRHLNKLPLNAARAQTAADQAALACALERYRLANGSYPETLEALVPRFITQPPHDMLTGEPYKYRRIKDGRFVLYSIGWDEKDDSGEPGSTLFDEKQGDWAWQYPQN